MEGFSIYLLHLGQLSFISLLFLWIGQQFFLPKEWTFRKVFFSLFFGDIFISTLFALAKTGGSTIMLGYLLLALFYLYEKKYDPIPVKKSHASTPQFLIMGLLFGAFFVFTWSFLTIGQLDAFPYHIPSGTAIAPNDYLINIIRSYYLGVTGEENYYHFFNRVDEAYHGPKPYHYLEMWTTAVMTSVFGGLAAIKFTLLTTPLYHLMAFLGILALWEKYQTIKWYHLGLSASFLFFAGLHFSFYEQWKILNFSLPIFTHRIKMCTYYPFIFAFIVQFDTKRSQQSILLLSGLLLATVVVAPALLGGIGLFLAYQFLIVGNHKNTLKTAGYVVTIALFIFFFYKFIETGQFNIRANAGASSMIGTLLKSLTTKPLDKIITLFTILLHEGVLYLPLFLVVGLLYGNNKKIFTQHSALFVLVLGIILGGASIYTLLFGQKDATQLFYNMGNATLNCILIWAVIKLLSQLCHKPSAVQVNWKHYGIGIVFLVMFYRQVSFAVQKNIYPARTTQPYSDEYLQQIKTYILSDQKTTIGVAVKGGKDYTSGFSKQTAAYTLGYYLAYMENGAIALNISDFDIPNPNWGDKLDRTSNLFYRFVEGQKAAKKFVSIGQSQVDFIKKYDLSFIILSKNGTLREEVQAIVKDTFIDKVSRERFLVIEE